MTEQTPRLQPVSQETSEYAPYSLLAVLAIVAAVLFLVLFAVLGISAWISGTPLEERELLVLPLAALVLAFAGRRQILNSEGTRVGLSFCNAAWWIAIIGGLGFAMYLVGIAFAVRRDAEDAFVRWTEPLKRVNPVDLQSADLGASFHKTLALEKQPTVLPGDTAKMKALLESQLLAFRQSDLVRLVYRNGGQVKFEVIGLEDRKNDKNNLLNCRITVKVISGEGEHVMSVAMRRQTLKGASEPIWQIVPPQNELSHFIKSSKLNNYGERIRDMELAGQQFVYVYLLGVIHQTGFQPGVLEEFTRPLPKPQTAVDALGGRHIAKLAALGGVAWFPDDPLGGFEEAIKRYYTAADRGDPLREAEQRKAFARVFRLGTMTAPSQLLTKNADLSPIMIPGETRWEIRIPVEMQPLPADSSGSAARGTVVLVVDDAEFLKELKDLKTNPGELKDAKPRYTPDKPVPWKLERFESDMRMIAPRPEVAAGS